MPKETFFNIDKDKRQRILDVALDEFSKKNYSEVGITKIIKRSGIASGSFYQYFEDKKDLFFYLLNILGDKKLEHMKPILDKKDEYDFFELLRKLYICAIKFVQENPKLERLGARFMKGDHSLYEDILEENKEQTENFFKDLITNGITKGELDKNIDINMATKMIIKINNLVTELFYEDGKIDMSDMKFVDDMLYILKNGLKK
ncbi:MAG: TetR/AcrR family transcriptional regulator [Fusobacteriota bacterium]